MSSQAFENLTKAISDLAVAIDSAIALLASRQVTEEQVQAAADEIAVLKAKVDSAVNPPAPPPTDPVEPVVS